MDDIDFPRGKYPTYKDSLAKKVSKRPADDELFSTRVIREDGDDLNNVGSKSKKSKPSKNKKSEDEVVPGLPNFNEKIIIYRLKVANVAIGSTILGCVTEIRDFEMCIQLPGAIMVKVGITNISEPYSKALAAYASDPAKNSSPPKPKSLFTLGDLLPVKILDKKDSSQQYEDTPMNLVDITASINPKDVYSDLNTSLFIKNCFNSCVSAAVIEIEDHGYLMDVGKENVHGFLAFEGAKPYLEAHSMDKLHVGQVLVCNVTSASSRVIKLTTKSVIPKHQIDIESHFPASCLLPGLQVTGKVLGIHEKGLEVVIFGQHRGFVHRDHLKTIWDLPRDDYLIGTEVTGIILFVNPINKVASISLRLPTEMAALKNTWSQLKVGQLIEGARIVGRDTGEAFIFKFPNGFKGIAPKGELSDDYVDSEEFSVMEGRMPIGSSQKCRIKSFSYLDGFAKVTLKPSLLSEEVISVENLSIGQVVQGRVKRLTNKGLIVNIGFAVKAICPSIHHKEAAKPKDYQAGSKIKCRIIRLDTSALIPRIAVSCKKEIIREPNIIDDINKATPGAFTHGIIALIKPEGLLVEFFNELRGWLSATRLAKEGQQYVPSLYSIGQVLPVYITGRDLTTRQIYLSLTYNEADGETETSSSPLGTILNDLVVSSKDGGGFLLVSNDRSKYYLPKSQLTDFPALTEKIYRAIDETDTIDKVVIYNHTTGIPVVSLRGIFIHAAESDNPVFKPNSLNPDLVVPAIIVDFKCYGIMIECPGGLIGLVPTKNITKPAVDPLKVKIPKYQTILVHINEVKKEENKPKRLNCSMIVTQCQSPDIQPETVLTSYLTDYAYVASKLNVIENTSVARTLSIVRPGDVLTCKVVETLENQILVACSVPDRKKPVPGVIISSDIENIDFGKIGHSGEAVVLYLDIEKKLIHLSADPEIVKNAKSAIKAKSYARVTSGQVLNGLVQLITDKYNIVSLKGHGIGALAYVPRYHHLNSVKPTNGSLSNGQKIYFRVNVNRLLSDGSRIIVGNKTVDKPTAVKNKEAQAAQAKLKKQEMKRLGQKVVIEQAKMDGDEEEGIGDHRDHTNQKKANGKDGKAEKMKKTKEKDENGNGDADSDDSEDADEPKIKFIMDTKGSFKKTERARKNSTNEDDDISSVDSDDNDDNDLILKDGAILKKRKRRTSEMEGKVKDAKKKHFMKIQSLLSNRVKSAVADENEVFFWDTTGDPKLVNKESNIEQSEETDAYINVPIGREAVDDEESGPLSKEEFEKLIVESPNDIDRWCRYINYYLGQAEITKAKELCERALETIDHKMESAKLRIWSLKLKIEYKHGSPESMNELIVKALCANDEMKVYCNLISLYEDDGKTELAEQTFREATKKHPLNKTLWINFGRFYLKHGRVTSFRDLVQRAINYMDKKEQLDLIIKFAQLECQFGDLERAKTMFEATLNNFPKRTDIWSIYIDMMIKYGLREGKDEGAIKRDAVESIRLLFERATSIKVKEKKIRFLFHKYINFERQHGDEERVALINKKMAEYVEANDIVI